MTADVDAPLLRRLTELRHDLHRHPELGFRERRTQRVVAAFLAEHGCTPRACARTGLIADIGGDGGPTIALRADLDALPIDEDTDLEHRSNHAGVAHKCGHDGHTAMLCGVAAMLCRRFPESPGRVRLLFQPDEEGQQGGGAQVMIAEGALDGVDEVYGLHNWPGFPFGDVRVRGGPTMAAVHNLFIDVRGRGGHAAQPHRCRDPVLAAAAIVTALQSVVSRGTDVRGGAVLSITSVHAGTATNVIPDRAALAGTFRCFATALGETLLGRIAEVVRSTAKAHGVEATLRVVPEYPVLVNDAGCAAAVADAAAAVVGEPRVGDAGLPLAVSEDFAYFAQERPAAYFFLGAGDPPGETPGCHHPDFDFDDRLLGIGPRILVELATRRLAALQSRPAGG